MQIKPIHDILLVKLADAEKRTGAGLYIPDTVKQEKWETARGEVIASGPGAFAPDGKFIENTIKVGQFVIVKKYAGSEVEIDGKKHLLVSEGEVLATVET